MTEDESEHESENPYFQYLDDDPIEIAKHQMTSIPSMSKEEINRRASMCRILKDVQVHDETSEFLIANRHDHYEIWEYPCDKNGNARIFGWGFKYDDDESHKVRDLKKEEMIEVGKYPTLHDYGYILIFKPSIEEVMRCLPEELFKDPTRRYLIDCKAVSRNAVVANLKEKELHKAWTKIYLDPDLDPEFPAIV